MREKVLLTISILILILNVLLINAGIYKVKNYIQVEVEGVSMQPAMYEGDTFKCNKNVREVNIGDIIVFKRNNKLIAHRVIVIGVDYYITKGDNNSYEDLPITDEDIYCKVAEW